MAPTKRVRISAYSTLPMMHEDSLVTIRVYCVPDCVNAMENVRKQEAEQNGKLLSDSLEFLMQESGDLCLNLEETEREIEFSDDGYTSPCSGVRYVVSAKRFASFQIGVFRRYRKVGICGAHRTVFIVT